MTYQSDVVALSPWGYWRLEETSGSTAADSSGNGRTATIVSTPTMGVTGQVGNAFTFATSGQCVRLGAASTAVSGSTAHTVMGWVKRSGTPSAYTHIAGPWSSTGVSASFRIALNASGQAAFEVKDNTFGTTAATGSANLYDGNWHFVVGTISGTAMKLYVDGVIAATATRGGSSINAAGADFCIGSQWSAYDQGGGTIDEVAWINNAALAPYQINNLYVSGKPSAQSYQTEVLADAPGAYLRLDEASGNFADTSGFGNTFTAQTGVSYSQTPMGAATGTGNAVHGDGSHGIATLASLAGLTGTTQTIETIFYMPAGNVTGTIAKIGGSGNGWDIGIWLAESSGGSGRMLGIDRNGLSYVDVGVNPISTGWHHVVAARNGNSMVVVFDGTEVYNNSAWNADGPGSAGVNSPSAALNVGFGDGTNLSSTVVVDSVAWYPTTLSTARAQAHYTALTSSGTNVNVGTASETDSSLAVTTNQSITLGTSLESDAAVAVTSSQSYGVGTATETDSAPALGTNGYGVGTASETDTAVGLFAVNQSKTVSISSESDTALPVTITLPVLVGTATETDTAPAILTGTIVNVGTAVETDTAVKLTTSLRSFGVAPRPLQAVTFTRVYESQRNRDGSWERDNIGLAVWEPPVVNPPAHLNKSKSKVFAQAWDTPTIVGTQPVYTPTYLERNRHRDRIVINGKDITYWRDVPTPFPEYQLIQPLLYGACTITLPQAVIPFETPGQGQLSFLKPGAPVKVQRVDADGNIVATDYRGVIVAFNLDGGELSVECGGHASGRMALRDRQMQLIQRRTDAGVMVARTLKAIHVKHSPPLGRNTGIDLLRWGGSNLLDYFNELVAKMVQVDGDSWTVMPNDDVIYHTYLRDLTTIDGTLYIDDSRIKADLRRDISEEPNRIFAQGVGPHGMVHKFGAYPGLLSSDPPPYPMADHSTFGVGTTNADTDTGDGITVMLWRLHVTGYIELRSVWTDYDNEVARAITQLQQDADLPVSIYGEMTYNTWRALFDISATGFSLRGIKIMPAAQTNKVDPWRRTSTGSRIGRNPHYDPSVLPVDRTIDMGTGFKRRQIREWSREQLATEHIWRGTIDITTGAIVAGDHTPGTPVTDLLRSRAIKPGMNLSIPLFDGGIVFHVAGVSVSSDGMTVQLIGGTVPEDTLPAWAAIQRNRENRNTIHRSFNQQNKASELDRDNTFDEIGGVIEPTKLFGGQWNIFPVIAKQAGTIEKLHLKVEPANEYVVGVFGRRLAKGRLARITNAPLTAAGKAKWKIENLRDDLDKDHHILYIAGSDEQPCGYYPKTKTDDGATLTGRWEDDAGFDFVTWSDADNLGGVLWVAIWATEDCTLQGGRIMWPTSEDY